MTDTQAVERIVARANTANRHRNAVIVALTVTVSAIVLYLATLSYGASVDSHAASRQTIGLQQANRRLLEQLKGDDEIIKRDDALIKAATSPESQKANADATARAVEQLIRCIDNHFDVLAGLAQRFTDCPPVAAPTSPTTTTTTRPAAPAATSPPVERTAAPTVPTTRPAVRPATTPSTTTTTSCTLRLGDLCI